MPDEKLAALIALSDRLLAPNGCPWDREQSPASLKPFVLEEAYEVCEAIDGGDPEEIKEELGDLLFQVVFQTNLSKIETEEKRFDINDVIDSISQKLIRRHPHVFTPEEVQVSGSGEVLKNWEAIKREEKKKSRTSALDGVPTALPALVRAGRLTEKAARVGFDWPDASDVLVKLEEELGEWKREISAPTPDRDRIEDELGDVLFVLVNWARKSGLDAEGALNRANRKFVRRFQAVEKRFKSAGLVMENQTLERMDAEWDAVKADEG